MNSAVIQCKPVRVLLMTSRSGGGFNPAPPLGLWQLKGALNEHNFHCDILDFDIDNESEYLANVRAGFYDIIGMSVSHINMREDLDTLLDFRTQSQLAGKQSVIIAGGQEATLNYKQWLQSGVVDLIFLGFAEEALCDFCTEFSRGDSTISLTTIASALSGVAFCNEQRETHYSPAKPLTSEIFKILNYKKLFNLQVPYQRYWDKAKRERIEGVNHTGFIYETVRLYTTSHCPRRCGFCSSQSFLHHSQQHKLTILMLTAHEIFNLVLHYVTTYGARGVLFSDDDFPVGNIIGLARIKKFCELILEAKKQKKLPEDVRFFCQSRIADFIDSQGEVNLALLHLMKEAGFDNTGLGVETLSPRLLSVPSVNKVGVTLEITRKVLDALLDVKITPIIFIIVGIPESTPEELVDTMRVAVEYISKGADVSVTARMRVNPGAPLCKLSGYPVHTSTWHNRITDDTIDVQEYFIPHNPLIAHVSEGINDVTSEQLSIITKARGWEHRILPKSLLGIATFIAATKLLERTDIVDEFTAIMEELLKISS